MKYTFLLCLWLCCITTRAQTYIDKRNGLPRDSASYKVLFTGVVQAPTATQSALYSAAREWFSAYYNSGKSVLDMDDRVAGKLIGSGYNLFTQKGSLGLGVMRMWCTTKIYVKDGRWRYEITNFITAPDANPTFKKPLEQDLDSKSFILVDKNGAPRGILRQMVDFIQQEQATQVTSITKTMEAARPGGKAKDW